MHSNEFSQGCEIDVLNLATIKYQEYRSCWDLELLVPNRYKSDLLNEVLYILVGQEAAEISNAKVGGLILPDQPGPGRQQFLIDLQL